MESGIARRPSPTAVLLAVLLAAAPGARASETEPKPGPEKPGLDAYPAHTLPPPPLMDGIGSSELAITTDSAEAQEYFNQGLRLLHCFWEFEAYRAFKEAARLDPECALCHWGMYRALRFTGEFEEERKALLAKAVELMDGASDRERSYIRASQVREEKKGEEGGRAFVREMEALIERHPEDVEAQLLLALSLMSGYEADGRPREGTLYSRALLENLLRTHPDHPAVHHYWIHATEGGSRAHDALASARRLAEMAPASGHMLHMPGHVYYHMGDYEAARAAFVASMEVDLAYMAAQGVAAVDDWNYVHNLNYLVASCAEDGRYQEGLRRAETLQGIPLDPKRPGNNIMLFIQGRGALVRFQLRYGDWQAAAGTLDGLLAGYTLHTPSSRGYLEAWRAYAVGMARVEAEDPEGARRRSDELDAHLWRMSKAKEDPEDPYSGLGRRILEVHSLELRGWVRHLEGEGEEALDLLAQAVEKEKELGTGDPPGYARPVHESLGRLHLASQRWQEAREAFGEVLERRPGSGHALYGVARSYALEGRDEEAAAAFQELLHAWRHADPDLPQILEVQAWLEARDARQAAGEPRPGQGDPQPVDGMK